MKKKIRKVLILFLFSFIIFPSKAYSEESVDTNLEMDNSTIYNDKSSGYKSVLDIYNINLFSENESERTEREKEKQELEVQRLTDSLFNEELENEKEFSKEIEKYNLFSQKVIPSKISYTEVKSKSNLKYIILIVVGCLITGVLTRLYYVKKYKGEKEEFEYYNYARL